MNTAFKIDFQQQNIRARIPSGSEISGTSKFGSGLLVQGKLSGVTHVEGVMVVLEDGVVEGVVVTGGDTYIMGHVKAERLEVHGVLYVGDGGSVSGYVLAQDYQLFAGADIKGSLHKFSK
ncbi:polymer-forming cytoskeletal protein (plasmid) [Comamonas aquatica]|nr:polymer-forming cytoskeletal protein [Comamonas aquatica]